MMRRLGNIYAVCIACLLKSCGDVDRVPPNVITKSGLTDYSSHDGAAVETDSHRPWVKTIFPASIIHLRDRSHEHAYAACAFCRCVTPQQNM